MTDFDWISATGRLHQLSQSPDADDLIISLCNAVGMVSPHQAAAGLCDALKRADSVFVRARTAHILALIAPDDDAATADRLFEEYQQCQDGFLAPELLQALGNFACRNTVAYGFALSVLPRLSISDPPFLLMRAAKVIGRLERERGAAGLRAKLEEIARMEPIEIQAEAFHQQGLLAFSDALLAPDTAALEERLQEARLFFLRSEASEESRNDSSAFIYFLDAALALFGTKPFSERIELVEEAVRQMRTRYYDPAAISWFAYQSPLQQKLMLRLLGISDALRAMASETAAAEEWTDFARGLVEVASAYQLIATEAPDELGQLGQAFSQIAPRIVAPKLGTVLLKAVSRVRFEK